MTQHNSTWTFCTDCHVANKFLPLTHLRCWKQVKHYTLHVTGSTKDFEKCRRTGKKVNCC